MDEEQLVELGLLELDDAPDREPQPLRLGER